MKAPYILSAALAALMVVQSVLGRVFPGQYRDVEWIRTTWFGNDWITLVVGAPLLVASLLLARRGSIRGLLLWRRNAWGYIVAAIAGIQGSLYLLVLSINSAVAILRGLAEAPGELPLWGTLAVTTTAVTFMLLANVRGRWEQRS
jgi:uncharacterized protein (DUF983 family)